VIDTTEFLMISGAPSNGIENKNRPLTSMKIIIVKTNTQNTDTTWHARAKFFNEDSTIFLLLTVSLTIAEEGMTTLLGYR